MLADVEVPIVIVGFGNADDIVKCLAAVAHQRRCPKFGVFICENGGPRAFEALVERARRKRAGRAKGKSSSQSRRRVISCGRAGCGSALRETPVTIGKPGQSRFRRGHQRVDAAVAGRTGLDRILGSQPGHLA